MLISMVFFVFDGFLNRIAFVDVDVFAEDVVVHLLGSYPLMSMDLSERTVVRCLFRMKNVVGRQ